jgi:hypothetical protein
MLVIVAAVLGVLRLATDHERHVRFDVRGNPAGLELDVAAADVEVTGGGRRPAITVDQREHYAFGHAPDVSRAVRDGIVVLRSRCPRVLLHRCTVGYRIVVPDNIPLTVRTTGGDVRFRGYRGSAQIVTRTGSVDLRNYCGFALEVETGSGNVSTDATCSPQQLGLRSTTGSIHAVVPGGRYRIDASQNAVVHGLTDATDAPFSLQALSGTGTVTVEQRR